MSLVLIISITFFNIGIVCSSQFSQCGQNDILFVHSKIPVILENNAAKWNLIYQVQTDSDCFLKCWHHTECRTATFNVTSKNCTFQDINRFTVNTDIKLSDGLEVFEKRTADFDSKIQFIALVENSRDCKDIYEHGWNIDGVYGIRRSRDAYIPIRCNMSIFDGGWTVVQKRFDGSVDFSRKWIDYKRGFGDLSGEFWYGNEALHHFTFNEDTEILFILTDANNTMYYPAFDRFKVGSENEFYRLDIGNYVYKDIGPVLEEADENIDGHRGMKFTTVDSDNDIRAFADCAERGGGGGWWYYSCMHINLNGLFGVDTNKGIKWRELTVSPHHHSLKTTEILIRRK